MTAKCYEKDANGKNIFRWIPSGETNVALTIKRERKRLADEAAAKKLHVVPMRKGERK